MAKVKCKFDKNLQEQQYVLKLSYSEAISLIVILTSSEYLLEEGLISGWNEEVSQEVFDTLMDTGDF